MWGCPPSPSRDDSGYIGMSSLPLKMNNGLGPPHLSFFFIYFVSSFHFIFLMPPSPPPPPHVSPTTDGTITNPGFSDDFQKYDLCFRVTYFDSPSLSQLSTALTWYVAPADQAVCQTSQTTAATIQSVGPLGGGGGGEGSLSPGSSPGRSTQN